MFKLPMEYVVIKPFHWQPRSQGLASSHRRGMLFSGAIPARQAYARDLITLVADFKLVLGGEV